MTGHPLRPATRQSLGRPSPHQQADRPRAHPLPEKQPFQTNPCRPVRISRISYPFEQLSRKVRGRLLTCYSPRSPLINQASLVFSFDLHVLSTPPAFVLSQDQTLRTKNKNVKAQKNQPKQNRLASNPNQKHSKTKNRHKKTNKHTIEFTNNTHTIKHTRISRMFSKGVPRHVSATRASRFVRCRSAQQGKQYALVRASSNQAQSMQ